MEITTRATNRSKSSLFKLAAMGRGKPTDRWGGGLALPPLKADLWTYLDQITPHLFSSLRTGSSLFPLPGSPLYQTPRSSVASKSWCLFDDLLPVAFFFLWKIKHVTVYPSPQLNGSSLTRRLRWMARNTTKKTLFKRINVIETDEGLVKSNLYGSIDLSGTCWIRMYWPITGLQRERLIYCTV